MSRLRMRIKTLEKKLCPDPQEEYNFFLEKLGAGFFKIEIRFSCEKLLALRYQKDTAYLDEKIRQYCAGEKVKVIDLKSAQLFKVTPSEKGGYDIEIPDLKSISWEFVQTVNAPLDYEAFLRATGWENETEN